MNGKGSLKVLGYSALTLFSALGIWGVWLCMTEGLKVTSLTAFEPWGIWAVAYSFLIGLSAGCVLLASMYTVFGKKDFKDVAGPALLMALISQAVGILFIWLELGQPFRVLNLYLHPNWDTGMARLAWFYPIYFFLTATSLYLWLKPVASASSASIRWVGLFSSILALAVNWDIGNIFAENFMQHLWAKEWAPTVYLGLAIISGLGMGLVLQCFHAKQSASLTRSDRFLFSYLIFTAAFYAAFILEEMIRNDSMNALLFGEYKYAFWIGQFGFLILLPLIFGWAGKRTHRPAFFGWAGLSSLAGIYMSRMYSLFPGSPASELNEMETLYHGKRLVASGYLPNLLEVVVILGLLALIVLAYLFISKFLDRWTPMGSFNKKGLHSV